MRSQDVVGALDQQTSEVCVAGVGDAELRIVISSSFLFHSDIRSSVHRFGQQFQQERGDCVVPLVRESHPNGASLQQRSRSVVCR